MKIALIYTPLVVEKNWTSLKAQEKNLGTFTPLSLSYVAAVCEQEGHEVLFVDAVALRLSVDEVVGEIQAFSPDMLGFTITTYGFHQTLSWIEEIKKRTGLPVMVGGWHLYLYPEETMTHKCVDYAILGYGHDILPPFLHALENGTPLSFVDGIAYREGGHVSLKPTKFSKTPFDEVPFPARHLLPNEKYYNFLTTGKRFTGIISALGCPYRCAFCELKTLPLNMRSAENFVDELEECNQKYGVEEFDIYDSSFTVNKKRVREICRHIVERGLKITWTMRTRTDCVDKEVLEAVSEAGCTVIMYGIESGNKEILKTLRKDNDLDRIKEVIELTKQFGIRALGFFMIGSPGETRETVRQTIRFAKTLPLDYVQFTRVLPFANTELYNMMLEDGGDDYWRQFTLDPDMDYEMPLVRTELSPEECYKLVKRAYIEFYFRPTYVWNYLKQVRSFFELKNGIVTAWDMLFKKAN